MAQDPERLHRYAIVTDQELEFRAKPRDGWWFKMYHSWFETGWWAVLTPAARGVLGVMAKFANEAEGGQAWPGVETIMRFSGLDQSSVYRALVELEESTILKKVSRGYKGKRHPSWVVQEAQKYPRSHPKGISRQQEIPADEKKSSMGNSRLRETSLLEGDRSKSGDRALESRSTTAAPSQEVKEWAKALTDDEAAALREIVWERLTPVQQSLLAKSSIKTSPILAAIAYGAFHAAR